MSENIDLIISLYDGKRCSREVADILGLSARYVRRIAKKYNLDRLHCGAQNGENNHQFLSGRRIGLSGYAEVTAPPNHPSAKKRKNRGIWLIPEHRLVMEKKIGRYLNRNEVIDHIDGLTLHNDPNNLRLFQKNGIHLYETLTGRPKQISVSGRKNISTKHLHDVTLTLVDIYSLRKKRGDVRLRQILRAALKLGIDSPHLLGTHHHLEKAGIDWSSRSNLEHALDELERRWEEDLLL